MLCQKVSVGRPKWSREQFEKIESQVLSGVMGEMKLSRDEIDEFGFCFEYYHMSTEARDAMTLRIERSSIAEKWKKQEVRREADRIICGSVEKTIAILRSDVTDPLLKDALASSSTLPRKALDMILQGNDDGLKWLSLTHPCFSIEDFTLLLASETTADFVKEIAVIQMKIRGYSNSPNVA